MIKFLTAMPKSLIVALGLGSMTLLSGCVADGNVYTQPAGYGYHNGWHRQQSPVIGVGLAVGIGGGKHRSMHRGMHRGMRRVHHCVIGVVC